MAGKLKSLEGAWTFKIEPLRFVILFTERHYCFFGEEEGRIPVEAGEPDDREALALFRSMRARGGHYRILEQDDNRLVCESTAEYARVPRGPSHPSTLELVFDDDDVVEAWRVKADGTRVAGSQRTWNRLLG